jgi:hypothetical protein
MCPYCSGSVRIGEYDIKIEGNKHEEVRSVLNSVVRNVSSTLNQEQNGTSYKQLELRAKLTELENEHQLAREGLNLGGKKTVFGFVGAMASLFVASGVFIYSGKEFISGTQLVIMFATIVVGLVAYYSFVFRRISKIKLEISKNKQLLEIETGKSAD